MLQQNHSCSNSFYPFWFLQLCPMDGTFVWNLARPLSFWERAQLPPWFYLILVPCQITLIVYDLCRMASSSQSVSFLEFLAMVKYKIDSNFQGGQSYNASSNFKVCTGEDNICFFSALSQYVFPHVGTTMAASMIRSSSVGSDIWNDTFLVSCRA